MAVFFLSQRAIVFSSLLCCLCLFSMDYTTEAKILPENTENCNTVAHYYGRYAGNSADVPPTPVSDAGLGVCAHTLKYTDYKSCCVPVMEQTFLDKSWSYITEQIATHNEKLKYGITNSSGLYQDHLKESLTQARNQTASTLQHLFRIPKSDFGKSVDVFFAELESFVKGQPLTLESIVDNFFNDLFPHVFKHVLSDPMKVQELGTDFETCLHDSYKNIKPFGKKPAEIARNMKNAFERSRIFFETLRVMLEVIDMTETLPIDASCRRAITKLEYCHMCTGFTYVRPCRGLCLNVMRGCLVYDKDLSPTWDELVIEFENVLLGMFRRNNAQDVLAAFDGRLKAAIWHIMEDMNRVYKQVTTHCQASSTNTTVDRKLFSTPGGQSFTTSSRSSGETARIREDIRQLVEQLQDSKGFLQRLADDLCRNSQIDPVMDSDDCWNGSYYGRYTHSVPEMNTVSQALSNVEVTVSLIEKPEVLKQKENLLHMRQRLSALFNEELMQQDDAYRTASSSETGSGGYSHTVDVTIDDDEDYNNIGAVSGSGSGDGGDKDDATEDTFTPTEGKDKGDQGTDGECKGNNCGDASKGENKGPKDAASSLQWSLLSAAMVIVMTLRATVV